eukprot:Gb_27287 [translate_table: standard]
MAIVKRGSRVSRVSSQSQSQTHCSSSTDDEGPKGNQSWPYDDTDDADSGAGSDSSDGSDIGEKGTELCQVGDQNCAIPYELFDLPDLTHVLSLDTWNHCLTEEERFGLSAYLPDMDQHTFMDTLTELLAGENFHFGSPLVELFDRLKGGLCQPKVAQYREGLEYLQRKEHYHLLRRYQNSMVNNLLEMKQTWENCQDLGIEQRLQVWNAWKDRKALVRAETQSLPLMLSQQKAEPLQKGKPGRPPGRSSKQPKLANDEELLEVAYSLPREKGRTNNLDRQCLLPGKLPARSPTGAGYGMLDFKETEKVGKRVPKGILKVAPKCLLRKHEQDETQPELRQLSPFSEIQSLERKAKPLSLLPPVGKRDNDGLVGRTSCTMRNTRSRTKMNSLETPLENAKRQRGLDHVISNAGLGKSSSGPGRKQGRVKEREMFNKMGVQVPVGFGGSIECFKKEDNCARGKGVLKDSGRPGGEKNLVEQRKRYPQEFQSEGVNMISSEDIRRHPQERSMSDDDCLDAEVQLQNSEKQNRTVHEHQKNLAEQYVLQMEQDLNVGAQHSLSFEQEKISDNKELAVKDLERHHGEQKDKKDCQKSLEQPTRNIRDLKQQSKDALKLSGKQKILVEKVKGEQADCLEGQSEIVENRRHSPETSCSPDNSKRSDEIKKKRRKERQIDDVMTFDLETRQEESTSLESPVKDVEPPKTETWNVKDTEQIEADEFLPPHTKESEDAVNAVDSTPVSNLHNNGQPTISQQSGEATSLIKRARKNLDDDAEVLDEVVSNRLHGDAHLSLSQKTEERKTIKSMTTKKSLKENGKVLIGVAESNELNSNTQPSLCQQANEGKPSKRGSKKKEDAKVLDWVTESNGLHDTAEPSMCQESDECKPLNKKAKKLKADAEVLNGVADLNGLHENSQPILYQQTEESKPGKKRARKKMEDDFGSLTPSSSKQASVSDKVTADMKSLKKPSLVNVPPVVSSFSFSVIHLLSAVRTAMLSPSVEDISEVLNHSEKSDGERESSNQERQFMLSHHGKNERQNSVFLTHPLDSAPEICKRASNVSHLECERQASSSSIPFREIVKRVQMNPGDPCILEIQEPLQDLVRGVLKIFASKTAPPGVKGWKPLAVYDKSTRSWSWIGPVSSSSPVHEFIEVETSPEAWGISHKTLLKLVEAFANWLKNGQETLQQIVLLPTPPPPSMPTSLDEKERFRDLRSQKSSITITPSSADMRAYFRREEALRYSVPDRAFSYTAADGHKAVVAPLRRCGGKPTSKARDHFMLKPDRPPHVTILCLVRDAAARLPGSIGTRADVCTLIRDSQYIVEDVSDAQVNQVVSGALDRLHYERDPCVQFDGDRKLWVYLHTDRDEEDFEDDGTSSTKRWKRQKKDSVENSDLGPGHDGAYHCMDDQDGCGSGLGFDFCSPDYNGDSSSIYSGGKAELVYNRNGSLTSPRVLRSGFNGSNMEDGIVPFIELPPSIHSIPGSMHQSHPMGWEVLGLNPLGHGSNLHSKDHTSNEDFDDDAFNSERPVGLLSAGLL